MITGLLRGHAIPNGLSRKFFFLRAANFRPRTSVIPPAPADFSSPQLQQSRGLADPILEIRAPPHKPGGPASPPNLFPNNHLPAPFPCSNSTGLPAILEKCLLKRHCTGLDEFGRVQTPTVPSHNHGTKRIRHLPKCLCVLFGFSFSFFLSFFWKNTKHEIYPSAYSEVHSTVLLTIDGAAQQISRTYSSCVTQAFYLFTSIPPVLSPTPWNPPFYTLLLYV